MKRSADPNSDNLKAEFRQKLENYKAAPSENLWDKIELSLDKEEAKVYKNRFRLYSWLAAACLVLLVGFGVLLVPRQFRSGLNQPGTLATNANQPESQAIAKGNNTKQNSAEATTPESLTFHENAAEVAENAEITTEEVPAQPETVGEMRTKVNAENAIAARAKQPAETGLLAMNSPVVHAPETSYSNAATSPETAGITANPVKSEVVRQAAKAASESVPAEEVTLASTARQSTETGITSGNAAPTSAKAVRTAISETAEFANTQTGTIAQAVLPTTNETQPDQATSFQTKIATVPTTMNSDSANAKKANPAILALAKPVEDAKQPNAAKTEEKETEKASVKANRWLVSAGYTALSFNSGIKLGAKPYKVQEGNSIIAANEKANLAAYQRAVKEYNEQTSGAYSQAANVLVGFQLNNNWAVQTGFGYACNQEETHATYTFIENNYQPYPGNISQDNSPQTALQNSLNNSFNPATTQVSHEGEYVARYRYEFYNVPVSVRYQTTNEGVYYFATGGGSMNWLSSSEFQTEPQNAGASPLGLAKQPAEEQDETSFFRKTLLALHLQTGLGYRFASRWQAELALTGNQYLKPLVKDENAAGANQENPRSFGAGISLGYSF